jgi:aldehyde dehydrogenase (NAD+)
VTFIRRPDRLFIDGQWVEASSSSAFDVVDSRTEQPFLRVAEAGQADVHRAAGAARRAFDQGPWPRLSHAQRADHLREFAGALRERVDDLAQIWPRQAGILHSAARAGAAKVPGVFEFYADLAADFPFEERVTPTAGKVGILVREPVGVVGAIVPWNAPATLIAYKLAPALLAGCTIVLKASPEAPGEAYVMGEVAERVGLPPGVLNVLTADRAVSETLVRDPRVDKIAFTGSTAAGRRIASLLGERVGRYSLELGGKSAAVVLDGADLAETAATLAAAECLLTGQVCSSLTRIVIDQRRHDDMVAALADTFSSVVVGDPFDETSQMGPLATARQRDQVEGLVHRGVAEGADLIVGGGRPSHLERGFYVEPTVFGNVDNASTIAQTEIFGPVLSVIPARNEQHAIEIANDTIYGLNASVFTPDVDRARGVARQLRSGTVGHNAVRTDWAIAVGGFKQSGVGREGGREGLLAYLEPKTVVLEGEPSRV